MSVLNLARVFRLSRASVALGSVEDFGYPLIGRLAWVGVTPLAARFGPVKVDDGMRVVGHHFAIAVFDPPCVRWRVGFAL